MAKITIVTDLHVGAGNGIKESIPDLVENIEEEYSDFVFVLGDVIHDTGEVETDRNNLRYVVDQFDSLDKTVYFLAGNHDANVVNRRTFEHIVGNQVNTIAHLGDEYIAMIDSAFGRKYPNTAYLGKDAIDTLEHAMPFDPTPIVLSHFPITYTDKYQRSDWFSEYPEGVFPVDKKRIDDLEVKPNISIHGHMHLNDRLVWYNNGIRSCAVRPYTQFEEIDNPVCTEWYLTLDTDLLQNMYGDENE